MILVLLVAFLFGVVAGLRALLAPAALAWAAHLGLLSLGGTPFEVLTHGWIAWVLSALAVVEILADLLPTRMSRTSPPMLALRLLTGGLAGAIVGAAGGAIMLASFAGIVGAIIGTMLGRGLRARLRDTFAGDVPAGVLESVLAIGAAWLLVATVF